MSQPLVVNIPHRLGKEEAVRRLQSGIGRARTSYSHILQVQDDTWTGDRLALRVAALGQTAAALIDVADDHVRLEVELPWLLGKFGDAIKGVLRKEGQVLLEKK
jgi:hypothetical protein